MSKKATTSKVLLINPPVHDFAAYDFWAKPMGLLLIAKALKKTGVEPVLVDALDPNHPAAEGLPRPKRRAHGRGKFFEQEIPKPPALADVPRKFKRHGLPPERLKQAISSAGPAKAALITCTMTYWYRGAFEAVAAVREVFPDIPIILGGGYSTLCSEHARRHSGADVTVSGPVETWTGVSDILENDFGHETLFRPALDLYPRLEYAPVLTSRGCPFRCDYCASSLLFHNHVFREPEEVLDDISLARERGIYDFAFYDDALALSPSERLVPILEGVLQRGWKIRLHAPNAIHVQGIDDDLARLMYRAGFVTIRLGVETTASGAARWDKKLNPEMLPAVAEAFLKAGYKPGEVGAYILVGLPGQEVGDVEKDINSLWDMGLRPYIAEYSPIPGTPLFAESVSVSRYDLEGEPLTQNNSILPCATDKFTLDDLQRLKEMSWPDKHNKNARL